MPSAQHPKVVLLSRGARRGRHPRSQAVASRRDPRIAALEREFGAIDRHLFALTITARMRTALIGSLLIHLALVFGLGLKAPEQPRLDKQQALEVVLVNAKSRARPATADAQAQHNLEGGGNTDAKRRAQSPLPATREPKPDAEVSLAVRRVERLEQEARQVIAQAKKSAPAVETPPAKPAPVAESESRREPSAAEIVQRSMEIARLEAKISRDWDAYQQRPRRRFVGARTQEYRFARYVEDWRQKVERVGDLNYPQGARDQRLHGKLVVTVAIRADGTVEQVDINVPSGHKILDDAARRIVQLAAPFAAFPPDIAKEVDILHITRTWTFTTGDRFVSE